MVTGAIKSIISGLCVAIGFVFGRVILRSLTDAMKSWGVVITTLFVLFTWSATWMMYKTYDFAHAVCSVIVILCIHLAFWGIGYFSHE